MEQERRASETFWLCGTKECRGRRGTYAGERRGRPKDMEKTRKRRICKTLEESNGIFETLEQERRTSAGIGIQGAAETGRV